MNYIYKIKSIIILLFIGCSSLQLSATHIAGGNIYYRCLGNNQYEVTLEFRRDCFNGSPNAQFDDPASVAIFYGDGTLSNWGLGGQLFLPFNDSDTLNIIETSQCMVLGGDVCVQTTLYRGVVQLDDDPRGYILAYQRCCRNISLNNIVDPLNTGTTEWIELTPDAMASCNNAASFNQWPDIFICEGEELVFDHSATDLDGDSLVYKLCTPYAGATDALNRPQPSNPPPFDEVVWQSPFDLNNVLGGVPLAIDPVTGILTATPNMVGQYLVGVCVEEYRNGQLISETRRNFEYNVRICQQDPIADFEAEPNPNCDGLEVTFTNQSSAGTFEWFFDFPSTSADSMATTTNASFIYPGPGLYTVALVATNGMCVDTSFQEVGVSVTGDPSASFTVSSDDCGTDQVVLNFVSSVMTDQAITGYSWEFIKDGTLLFVSTDNNPIVTVPTGDLEVNLVVTTISGCTDEVSQTIDVKSNILSLEGDDISACEGSIVSLIDTVTPGLMLTWSPDTGLDLSDPENPMYLVNGTQTFTVIATDGICTIFDTITVTQQLDQQILIAGDRAVCDDQAQFTASLDGGMGAEFEWFSDAAFTQSLGTSNPITISVSETPQSVYVQLINNVCTGEDSLVVRQSVIDLDISINDGNPVCVGDTVGIAVNNMSSDVLSTYIWSGDGIITSGDGTANPNYVFDTAGANSVNLSVTNAIGCMLDTLINVDAMARPDLMFPDTIIYCVGDALPLNPNGDPTLNYNWSSSDPIVFPNTTDPNPVIMDLTSDLDIFLEVATNVDNACSASYMFSIDAQDSINLSVPLVNIFCMGEMVVIEATTDSEATIQWINSNGIIVFEGNILMIDDLPSGTYIVLATTDAGCTESQEIEVGNPDSINPIITTDNVGDLYCEGEDVLLSLSSDTDVTVVWSDENGVEIGQGEDLTVMPVGSASYTAMATDSFGCVESAMITLSPYLLDISVDGPAIVCVEEENMITITNNDPMQTLSYAWEPNGAITSGLDGNSITFSQSDTETYIVTLTNMEGCEWQEAYTVEISAFDPEVEITADPENILLGQSTQLSVNQDLDLDYMWSPSETLSEDDINNPIATPVDESVTYVVTVTDENGCTDTDDVTVTVRFPNCDENDIYVPNMFTPNGDDFNDFFKVESNFIDEMTMIVYDRWGEKVFETTQQLPGWDGTFEGEELPPDVYGWHLSVRCINESVYTAQGNISLMK